MSAMPRFVNLKTATSWTMLTILLGPLSAVAATEPPDEVPSRRVNYADLDLTHNAGVAVLYARIKSAARAVCLPTHNWVPEDNKATQQCREQALSRAIADVNAPALTDYYFRKTKQMMELR
jgi:UrcA family protein